MNKTILSLAVAAVAAGGAAAALAHGGDRKPVDTPYIAAEIGVQLRFDWTFAGDDEFGRRVLLYLDEGEAKFGLHLNDWFSIQTHFKGETVHGPAAGTSEAFRGFGVFMEQLYVDLDFKHVAFFAGKYNPAFGYMHKDDVVRGIFARDFVVDYETTEKIGFGFSLRGDLRDWGAGRHEFTTQAYFEDTTILRRSIFTVPSFDDPLTARASTLSLADGGTSNTETLNNWAFMLSGGGFAFLPALDYHVGYRLHRASTAGLAAGTETADEHAATVAFHYEFKLSGLLGGTTVTPVVEWARVWNAGGNEGQVEYFSAAVAFTNGPWELWFAGSLRSAFANPAAADIHDKMFAMSLDYKVTDWMKAGAGYRFQRVNDIEDHTVEFRIWFDHDFTIPLRR